MHIPTIDDVRLAANIIAQHLSPAPLIRSHALEKELGLPEHRHVWLKDYGWTPVGSFKLLGALNWMDHHQERIGDRAVVADGPRRGRVGRTVPPRSGRRMARARIAAVAR